MRATSIRRPTGTVRAGAAGSTGRKCRTASWLRSRSGCGATTLAVARVTGGAGRALGVDISAPMIARARERAAAESSPAQFLVADATIHDLSGERADLMISRFGVMFFADPALSFANLRKALK